MGLPNNFGIIEPEEMPPNNDRSIEDHGHMIKMQTHVHVANEVMKQLHAQIEFLLPHAAKAILHEALVNENAAMQKVQDDFDVMAKLLEPRLEQAIKDVVTGRRIDLLERFYK